MADFRGRVEGSGRRGKGVLCLTWWGLWWWGAGRRERTFTYLVGEGRAIRGLELVEFVEVGLA